jgi:adenosine 3'-phospho 5'-phosphosulfate transporter B2
MCVFSAISNTLSSWGQYQALSYVGFALQTVFKSTKVIPVMFMGILLKGTKYSKAEYLEALGITAGVLIFAMSKENFSSDEKSSGLIGFLLLSLYVLSDAFTSQWQSRLYRDYGKIDSFQMMFGVNVSSIIITAVALFFSGEIPLIIDFFRYNPSVFYYNVITAITSTTGQFAIYYTIKRFGPIVFTIIMTTRQMLSIVVSNYYFGHSMSLMSVAGAVIVFSVVLYSIYRQNHPPAGGPKDSAPVRQSDANGSTGVSDKV